jgi:hypothetical protein
VVLRRALEIHVFVRSEEVYSQSGSLERPMMLMLHGISGLQLRSPWRQPEKEGGSRGADPAVVIEATVTAATAAPL